MGKYGLRRIWYGLMAGVCIVISSCHDDSVNNPLIDEIPPEIRLIVPDSASILAQPGDSLSFTLLLADNAGLDSLRIYREVLGVEGSKLEVRNRVLEVSLNGREAEFTYEVLVPFYPEFTQVFYDIEVLDQKAAADQVRIKVTLLPNDFELSDLSYKVNTYRNKRIYAQLSDSLSGFNFTTQKAFRLPFTFSLDVDIAENSDQSPFQPQLISPNNDYFLQDSVFVISSTSEINFEEASYQIIASAYYTSDAYHRKTPVLAQDDMVIIRLIKSPNPQFALMWIKGVTDDVGSMNDLIEFDYKVSSE